MRELDLFEQWIDSVVEAPQHRPLPFANDLKTQAQKRYPGVDTTDAMTLFLNDKFKDNEKVDFDQNKVINAQKRENEKLRRSLSDLGNELHQHEKQAQDTDREVERLKQLSAKLKPAGEITQQIARASSEKIELLMKDLEKAKLNPNIDEKQFKEISDKVNQMKNKASSQDIEKMQRIIDQVSQNKNVNDAMVDKVSAELDKTKQELDAKEQRFRKSLKGNREKIQSWGNKFADLDKQIKLAQSQLQNTQDGTNQLTQKTAELEDKLKFIDYYEKHIQNTINNIEDAKEEISNYLGILRSSSLGQQLQQPETQDSLVGMDQNNVSNINTSDTNNSQTISSTDNISQPQNQVSSNTTEVPPESDNDELYEPSMKEKTTESENNEPIPPFILAKRNYTNRQRAWMFEHVPIMFRMYNKLYPHDLGTIIDRQGLLTMVEDVLGFLYMSHVRSRTDIEQEDVEEKLRALHNLLVLRVKKLDPRQPDLFISHPALNRKDVEQQPDLPMFESLLYGFEKHLDNITKINY